MRFAAETPAERWCRKIGTIDCLEELEAWKRWLATDGTVLPPEAAAALRAAEIRFLQAKIAAMSKTRDLRMRRR